MAGIEQSIVYETSATFVVFGMMCLQLQRSVYLCIWPKSLPYALIVFSYRLLAMDSTAALGR